MKLIPEPSRILIVRFSSIGDVVLTSPLLRVLRAQFPLAEIHYLTKAAYAPLVEHNPHLNRIFQMEGDDLSGVLRQIGKEHYDWLIDLHRNWRSLKVRQAVKSSNTFTVNKRSFDKLLMTSKLKLKRLDRSEHVVDRYFEALKKTDIKNDERGLELFLPQNESWADLRLPARWAEGYNAFSIGAAHNTKQLPYGYLRQLCEKMPRPVVLLGGPTERELGLKLSMDGGPHVYNACGRFDLLQSARAIQGATQVLTHDTGMMHIATAFQKPLVSFWGNTVPEFGFFPYYGRQNDDRAQLMEVHGLKCRPCSRLGHKKCPTGHFKCMIDQDFSQIEWC